MNHSSEARSMVMVLVKIAHNAHRLLSNSSTCIQIKTYSMCGHNPLKSFNFVKSFWDWPKILLSEERPLSVLCCSNACTNTDEGKMGFQWHFRKSTSKLNCEWKHPRLIICRVKRALIKTCPSVNILSQQTDWPIFHSALLSLSMKCYSSFLFTNAKEIYFALMFWYTFSFWVDLVLCLKIWICTPEPPLSV